jgi:ubiquinone/menaquinone biosynthesis C-methylase UbiE
MKNKYKGDGLYHLKKFIAKPIMKEKSDAHFYHLLDGRWDKVIGEKVLDAGCGYCEFLNYNPKKLDVHGVDIKKSNHKNVKQGDLNKKIPYQSDSFDTVTAFHVLEHLKEPEKAIKEFRRVLKKDGRLVLSVPSHSYRKFFQDYTHVRPYPKRALYNILVANGFKEIKITKGHHYSQIVNSLFFYYPKLRWNVEKVLGKISPWEITAIARCDK